MKKQWDKTEITHTLDGRKAEKDMTGLIKMFQSLSKIKSSKRGEEFGLQYYILYDVAACHHTDLSECSCAMDQQVPVSWREYLADQRGPRQLDGVLSDRALTLRAADKRGLSKDELEAVKRSRVENQHDNKESVIQMESSIPESDMEYIESVEY